MTDKPPIHEVLAKVMGEVRSLGKGEHNRELGFRFRGIDAVMNAVGPVLREHGVVPLPQLLSVAYRDVRTKNDKPAREVTVQVRYRFVGPAGDHLDVEVPGEAMDHGDKGTAKAMSVAMRIALLQALCLPTDEPDPEGHSYERAERDTDRPTAQQEAAHDEGDPALWRGRIKVAGDKQGRSLDWIVAEFAQRTQGGHPSQATVAELRAFHDWLVKQPDVWDAGEPK